MLSFQDSRNISHGDNYHDKLQYVCRTIGQQCYGHIDFITRAEIKSYDFSIWNLIKLSFQDSHDI